MATSYRDALKLLPKEAAWSASFGNPGEGGFVEHHVTPDGARWIVTNGPYYVSPGEFDWQCYKRA